MKWFKIIKVVIAYREFEEAITSVDSVQVQLGNSGYLNQDCTPDALNLYESLITSYRWTDNASFFTNVFCKNTYSCLFPF